MVIALAAPSQPEPSLSLREEFLRDFDQEALKALAALVAWNHLHETELACKQLGPVIGKECRGLLRWMRTSAHVIEFVTPRFPNVVVAMEPNGTNGSNHLEISQGRFRVVLDHDTDPDAVVPTSNYGQTIAKAGPNLFHDEEDVPEDTTTQFLVVLFNCKGMQKELPCRLQAKFPDGSGGYVDESINLYTQFTELADKAKVEAIVSALMNPAAPKTEDIPDQSHPKGRADEQAESA